MWPNGQKPENQKFANIRNQMADGQVAETPDRPVAMKYNKVPVRATVPARTIEFRPWPRPQEGGHNKVWPRPLKVHGRNISTDIPNLHRLLTLLKFKLTVS